MSPLQCLSRSEPLMRMAENVLECESLQCLMGITDKNVWTCIQAVSPSPVLEQIGTTDKNGWTCIQVVSSLFIWAAWIHWWEWLNMHPVCESLSSIWANQNHSQEWLNMHSGSESLFSVWAAWIHWWEWLNMHPGCESPPSPVFEQIRIIDKNGWTCIQYVSPSPVFEY